PKHGRKPISWGELVDLAAAGKLEKRSHNIRRSIGTPSVASPNNATPPGFELVSTYNDDQYWPSTPRLVGSRTTSDVHFVYSDKPTLGANPRYGYLVYDPVAASWTPFPGQGCTVQASDGEGWYANMDVLPNGMVVMTGIDDAQFGTNNLDNHTIYQTAQHSCFWGTGTVIPQSKYNLGFFDPTHQTQQPRVEVQEWMGDTIVHMIVIEEQPTELGLGDLAVNPLEYFRKFGPTDDNGADLWEGPVVLDSVNRSSGRQFINTGSITASRVSPKVAVAYTHYHQEAFNHIATHGSAQARYDVEIYRQENDSIGDPGLWSGPINTTNYSRVVASQTAFIDAQSLYDSEGFLHIVWTAGNTVDNVYDDPDYFWGDFSNGIWHWTDRTGQISKVYDANWGLEFNTQVCGFGDPGVGYVGQVSIGECDGNLYVIFSQYLDALGSDDFLANDGIDDCTSVGDRGFSANGEIEMVVSSTLDGSLWDAARNITKTFTAGCDSLLGTGGQCEAEHEASIARYGTDVSGAFTWPGTEYLDMTPPGDPPYAGNFSINAVFLEDHMPGPGFRDTTQYNGLTLNPLRWVRLACVDPVTAPQIRILPDNAGYPDHVDHGFDTTITVTITNDGNTALNILGIIIEEDTQTGVQWLDTANVPASVPAGASNTATFGIVINKNGAINNPGTLVALTGRVRIVSDAPSPKDTVNFEITNFIVGPVQPVVNDTVSTGMIALAVTSNGEMGDVGVGGANLDFTASGQDCDSTADIYLFDGSPLMIQAVTLNPGDSVLNLGTNLYVGGFGPSYAFKPVADRQLSNHFVGPDGSDAFFTGTYVNWDSSIAVEQTYYAPTTAGNDDFVVVETRFFPIDGADHSNLMLGDVIDWDVPADSNAINVSGIAGKTVYIQGVDSVNANVPGCVPYKSRFAANGFLGMYTSSEFNADNCANTRDPWGMYAANNADENQLAPNAAVDSAHVWGEAEAKTGQWTVPDTNDLRAYTTYQHGFTLAATETLTVYTALTSVYNGTATDVEDNIRNACAWYQTNLRPGCAVCSCCQGSTGNVNNDPGDITDVADLTALIDNLFISFTPLVCPEEGNINGDPGNVVDVADLTALIDHLFISFAPTAPCQ
ncbi:MAG: hypothetical protein D6800_13755, partial [Candidatus Zixiibacteriota bacterium]